LVLEERNSTESAADRDDHSHDYDGARDTSVRGRWFQIYLLLLMVAGLDFTVFMLNLPLTRVYESIICWHHWEALEPGKFSGGPDSIPEAYCKDAPVQEELALVRGCEMLFMSMPGMLLALPYGYLADRIGRRPVLMLCALGLAAAISSVLIVCHFWQVFPLRMLWAAWLFTVVGGGASVIVATTFSMLTDLTTEKERATVFLYLAVAILVGQAISVPLASVIMDKFGTTTAIMIGYFVGLVSCFMTILTKETTPKAKAMTDDEQSLPESADAGQTPEDWRARLTKVISSTATFVLQSKSLIALILSFFVHALGTSANSIIVQYASKRFSLPISRAGLFLTVRAIVTIVAFLVLIPLVSRLLDAKLGVGGKLRDLWIARILVLCVPIGFFFIAAGMSQGVMAGGMILTALGSGYSNMMRSVATGVVDPSHIAQLHGVITTIETLAQLLSGPLLAGMFSTGLRSGLLGLPFYIEALLAIFGCVLVWAIKLPKAIEI
jgi:hypothetical protein